MSEPSPEPAALTGAPVAPLSAALRGACPRCGERTLFQGWLRFAPRCRACGLDYDGFNVGDGPAAFLILIIGAVVTVAAISVDIAFSPAWWVHLVWAPVAIAMTVYGLRVGKGFLLGQEYLYRAREGKIIR